MYQLDGFTEDQLAYILRPLFSNRKARIMGDWAIAASFITEDDIDDVTVNLETEIMYLKYQGKYKYSIPFGCPMASKITKLKSILEDCKDSK